MIGLLLGCWVVELFFGLLDCCVAGLLIFLLVGLLWVFGLLACCVVGLLGCWVVGSATQQKSNQPNKDRKNRKDDKDKKDNPTTHNPIDTARRNARSD